MMGMLELFVVLIVALVAFGPKQLPMLARHLGRLFLKMSHWQEQAQNTYAQWLRQQQLVENEEKAKIAERDTMG